MSHLDEEQLFLLTLGQLPGEASALAQAHLEGCPRCQQRHANLSSIAFARTLDGASGDPQRAVPTRPDRPGAAPHLERGATLGRYVVLEKLGAGGMGDVFAAYDPQLDRRVALKLLRTGSLTAEEGKARLLREAQAMARLQHPNVISVHDVGTLGERVFIAMEFVDGESVTRWLRGQHPWDQVLGLFLQAGQGLASAHRAGLVHRDFKPDNVLVGADGRPRVLDFGLARQAGATPPPAAPAQESPDAPPPSPFSTPLTRDGAVMGTPGYMAPEQLSGLATDARSDQFSFCVALYEALYGSRPFGGATLKQHAQEMALGRVPSPPVGSPVPPWVHEVLRRGLSADPRARFEDMDALLRALQPASRRSRFARLTGVAVALLAVVGVGSALWTRQRAAVCAGQEQRLVGLWDAATRGRLQAAFAGTRQPMAAEAWRSVERTLDAWALDWVNGAREACEATRVRKTDSEELLALKQACLQDRRQQLESLVTLFGQPDRDVVLNAPAAARALDSPQPCGSSQRRRPTARDEGEVRAEAALRTAIATAQALFGAGKYAAASQVLQPALRLSAPPRIQAEGWLLLGRVETVRRDFRAAQRAHLTAAEQALKASDDAELAVALSRLDAHEGFDEGLEGSDVLGHLAQAAASRVPGEWEVHVELARNESLVALRRGRLAAARTDLERALSLQREHLPADHPDIASTLNNMGTVLTRLNLLDEAISSYQQSLAIHEAVEGLRHPSTAASAHNLAVAWRLVGRFAEAKALFERALSVRREALGPTHPDTLTSQLALARACTALGELDEAAALLAALRAMTASLAPPRERWGRLTAEAELALAAGSFRDALATAGQLLALAHQLHPGDSGLAAAALRLSGEASTGLGQWADAGRALAEAQRQLASGDPRDRAEVEEAWGHLELTQGRPARASPHFEAALALRNGVGITSPELAEAQLDLARCRVELGEAAAALDLGERARTLFSGMQVHDGRPRADFVVAQARWLLGADGGRSAQALLDAASALPPEPQALARRWMLAHGAVEPGAAPTRSAGGPAGGHR